MPTDARPVIALTAEQLFQPVPGGSGTYIVELLRALRRRDLRVRPVTAWHPRRALSDRGLDGAVRAPLPRVALYEAWNRLGAPRVEHLGRSAPDVVHATTWAVPATRTPLVVTVHDLAFLRDPGHFTPRGNAYFRRSLDRVRDFADAVVVPSRQTRDECVDVGIEASRIHVVPHGVRSPRPTDAEVTAFRQRHDLPGRFVLWCGTREPRKNLRTLLAAYASAADDLEAELVLVGPDGWGDLDLPPGDVAGVRWLGRLDDADLRCAYDAAHVFAFPSIREGFGMPVLEAMAHGTPVVTSAGSPMADIAGDAALLVDPADPDDLAAALVRASGPAHEALAQASLRRAALFSWDAAAGATNEVYDRVRRPR